MTDLSIKNIAGFTKNKQLVLKCERRICVSKVYKNKLQKHFNQLLMQVKNVFKAQPTIYILNKDKCHFINSLYNNTSYTNWQAMKK